ncbi:MAG TPA: hypothetical protein VLZ83_15670 [Edaphocola sp.]|nr:hypothetical protein [Edaphocola sp.]
MLEQIPFSIFENENIIIAPENLLPFDITELKDKKLVLFILPYLDKNESEKSLFKIFNACGLNNEEIFITQDLILWADITKSQTVKDVFLFGINPEDIGVYYQVFPYSFMPISNKKLIVADSIDVIMNNQQLKMDFWNNCLKPYYK